MRKAGSIVYTFVITFACTLAIHEPAYSQPVFDRFIERLLKKHPDRFESILENGKEFEIQICYTKIDRDKKGNPYFTQHGYGEHPDRYFYPASTIKLAAAALSLEKLNNLKIPGLDKNTTMISLPGLPGQTGTDSDTTSPDGLPSVAHYIKKILVASDNDAYNRLYDFLGQAYFNETMLAKGYTSFRATHRLEVPLSLEENKHTNPVRFTNGKKTVYEQSEQYSGKDFAAKEPILRGKGYMKDGKLFSQPMDFREKNAFALADQQLFLRNLMFPETTPDFQKLNLTDDDYQFLYRYMSQLPIETEYPSEYAEALDDAHVKYLLFGKTKKRIPRQIRSFNKIGEAYGYLLDNAYIVDFEKGVEFLLSAVIYCNEDGILNDDKYNYDVGYQFMADLGKTILAYELERKRSRRPDLGKFEVEYDR